MKVTAQANAKDKALVKPKVKHNVYAETKLKVKSKVVAMVKIQVKAKV